MVRIWTECPNCKEEVAINYEAENGVDILIGEYGTQKCSSCEKEFSYSIRVNTDFVKASHDRE